MDTHEIYTQYDQIGDEYIKGQKSFYSKRDDWTRAFVDAHVGNLKDKKLLDIGCGGGMDLKIFKDRGADVFGIDPSGAMVKAAQEIVSPSHVFIGDYEHIPFLDQSFDVVFGRFSLHYLKDFSRAYEEMRRVMIPGGKLFQIVSHPSFDLTYRLEEGHGDQELISVHLYDNKVRLFFPYHHLRDYFSSLFFRLFDLKAVSEHVEDEPGKGPRVPGALAYYAVAR